MTGPCLSVAAPWSLSHYIPLNGFHPLYRAVINDCPEHIAINAWDNLELSNILRGEKTLCKDMLASVEHARAAFFTKNTSAFAKKYADAFFTPNMALTSLLPGDIEFHHTAPFPSMTRPFVFHCESFAPIFFPFMQQGGGEFADAQNIRDHYSRIFSDPLCMGIFSHIPHTLEEISRFFQSPEIDAKLYPSRIGLSRHSLMAGDDKRMSTLAAPRFLFINSANQNPANFVHRGGHVLLRFWLKFIVSCPGAKLYLRCVRPADEVLLELGVDVARLRKEESRSVIWIQEFVSDRELNRLMAHVHFFLLPSASLHSVSIMQAMALGAIPFVSDTIGTDRYVTHGRNGIVLEGVRASNWVIDPQTGVLMDRYHRNPELEERLVRQIEENVARLMDVPSDYEAMRTSALNNAGAEFSGAVFGGEFWQSVQGLWDKFSGPRYYNDTAYKAIPLLRHCLLERSDWPRIFESVPQPMARIATGRGRVTELAGVFVYTAGNRKIGLHDWSVLAEYCDENAPPLSFVHNISELGGKYLTATIKTASNPIVGFCSRLLFPYPSVYRLASRLLKLARKWRRRVRASHEPEHVDIQLIAQDISGMNIIRCKDQYYAIPQDGGEFSEVKANYGGYRLCFKGSSLKRVLTRIAEHEHTAEPSLSRVDASSPVPILAEEGFSGFNIIHYADSFFAIPQGEGAFEHERIVLRGYSQFHVGATLEATKSAITGGAK